MNLFFFVSYDFIHFIIHLHQKYVNTNGNIFCFIIKKPIKAGAKKLNPRDYI